MAMTTAHEPAPVWRATCAPMAVLLAGMPQPHDELLALVWGCALTASTPGCCWRASQHAARVACAAAEGGRPL